MDLRTRLMALLVVWLFITALFSLVACQNDANTDINSNNYPNSELLVDASWLASQLERPEAVRIIDMREPDAYAKGHIPGAVNVPVNAIASTIDGIPLEFDRQEVQETLSAAGLDPEMTAIIYDDLGMMDAARMFWTLEYVGHDDARLLHGGWNAWVDEGRATSSATPQIESVEYPIALQPQKIASAEDVLSKLDDDNVVIVDARSPAEYSGEVAFADRGGHIPGAVNLVWLNTLTDGDVVYTTQSDWREQLQDEDIERFKPPAEIQSLLQAKGLAPDQEIITYCQTMWRGAHLYFLLRLMGYEDVRGYDGSWAEWGNRPDLPVVTGSAPGSAAEPVSFMPAYLE